MLLLTFTIIAYPLSFRAEANQNDINSLLEERQTDCWVEGERLGELILGSRGTIQFIYLDAKLSKAISTEQGLAPWVDDLNQYYGSPETRKKVLFIVNLEAKNPFGTVDAGTSWQFAFVVPQDKVKPGTEIMVGYGDDLIKWKVPK